MFSEISHSFNLNQDTAPHVCFVFFNEQAIQKLSVLLLLNAWSLLFMHYTPRVKKKKKQFGNFTVKQFMMINCILAHLVYGN